MMYVLKEEIEQMSPLKYSFSPINQDSAFRRILKYISVKEISVLISRVLQQSKTTPLSRHC